MAPRRRPLALLSSALLLVLLAATLATLGRGYRTLCAQPVDVYPALAAARAEARGAAQKAPAPLPALLASLRAGSLDLFLRVKQSDYVAFPLHALAGAALELGRCPPRSTSDQWGKAAVHAWTGWAARLAAAGLERTLGSPAAGQAALEALRPSAEEVPWHAANLARVRDLYRAGRGGTLPHS